MLLVVLLDFTCFCWISHVFCWIPRAFVGFHMYTTHKKTQKKGHTTCIPQMYIPNTVSLTQHNHASHTDTSGSTGKPKGVVHTTGGYMVYAGTTSKYAFGLQRGDMFWCTADCGWITGTVVCML